MDPICHTLVGASLAASGLRDKTRYGAVTLIVAANLPDIDVITHWWGETASYAFRRGITHGLPALIVLPVLLAVLLYGLDRVHRRRSGVPPANFRWLLGLSALGVATHPSLDWLNNYGMRWLMPFVDRWFYGDTLFIIDLIVWGALVAGLVACIPRIRKAAGLRYNPARVALGFVVVYVAANFGITQHAESEVLRATASDRPLSFMASPVPLDPLRRDIVLEYPDEYRFMRYRAYGDARLEAETLVIPKGPEAAFIAARASLDGRRFLHWARFPYAVVEEDRVRLADARYVRDIENPRLDGFGVLELVAGARPD